MLFVYGNRQFNRTGRGKFSGIGQQINQYLLQALGIRLDNQRSYRSFEQKQSAGLASILRCRQSRLTQLYYITFLPYEFYFSGFHARDVQNIIYEVQQQIGILLNDITILLFLGRRGIITDQHAGKSHNGIQGSAYFVTHIGQKSRLQPVGFLRFLLGYQQFLAGYFQIMFQVVDTDNIIYGYQETGYQEHERRNNPYDPIFILLIKRRSLVHQHRSLRKIQ